MRCAVITPIGPGHEELFLQCRSSVKEAFAYSQGCFADVLTLGLDDPKGEYGRSKLRNQAIEYAYAKGVEWLFFLDADDLMYQEAFRTIEKYENAVDALWGQIVETGPHLQNTHIRPRQITPLKDISALLENDPFLTIQMGHFVRTEAAFEVGFDEKMDTGEDFKYYLGVWEKYRCLKCPEILFVNRRGLHSTGPRSASGKEWRMQVERLLENYPGSWNSAAR